MDHTGDPPTNVPNSHGSPTSMTPTLTSESSKDTRHNSFASQSAAPAVTTPGEMVAMSDDTYESPARHDAKEQSEEDSDDSLFGSSPSSRDRDSLFGDPISDSESGEPEHQAEDVAPPKKIENKARNVPASDLAGLDAPEAMSCTLLKHQRYGLEWLRDHELGPHSGSILADDMGLGKTIQALALIHLNPPRDPERCKTTLIVAPLALLQQWPREIADKTKPGHKLSVHVFHGAGRSVSRRALAQYDVVVTNYDTLCAEFKLAEEVKAGMRLLHPDMHFHRVILDEAHNIKNRNALTSRGAFRLRADYKLCLTGTPMMNNPEELYGMVRFLEIRDFSDWQYFNYQIARPLNRAKSSGAAAPQAAMRKLRELTEMIMLVRKKTDLLHGEPIIALPGRTDTLEYCEFDEDEQEFYNMLQTKTEKEVAKFSKAYAGAHAGSRSFALMLVQLLKMRQACCHPDLLAYAPKAATNGLNDLDAETMKAIEASGGLSAETPAPAFKLRNKARKKDGAYYQEIEDDYQPSTKIKKTLEILGKIRDKAPEDKIIVFSFFTSYLDILAIGMRKAGFVYQRYDGTLNAPKKDAVIRDFVNPNTRTRVLLTSLQSGNAGLNLNCANHVIIQEPYWNPFIEAQAIDRAHRIGQTKEVHVYRLLVQNTVEDRIVTLQDLKKKMVGKALGTDVDDDDEAGGSKGQKMGLSKEDLMGLLSGNKQPTTPGLGLSGKDVMGLLNPSSKSAGGMSARMADYAMPESSRSGQLQKEASSWRDYSAGSASQFTPTGYSSAGNASFQHPGSSSQHPGLSSQAATSSYGDAHGGITSSRGFKPSNATSAINKRPSDFPLPRATAGASKSTTNRFAKDDIGPLPTPNTLKRAAEDNFGYISASKKPAKRPATASAGYTSNAISSVPPVVQGQSTPGQSTQGQSTQGPSAQGPSAQDSSTQGPSTQGQSTQGKSTQRARPRQPVRLFHPPVKRSGFQGPRIPSAAAGQGAAQGPSTHRPTIQVAVQGPSTQRPPVAQGAVQGPSTQQRPSSSYGFTAGSSSSTQRPAAYSVQNTVQKPAYARPEVVENKPGDPTDWGSLLNKYKGPWM